MKIKEWVKEVGGFNEAAQLLEVTPMAVRIWVWGKSKPLTKTMLEINRISKGRVTFDEMIGTKKRAKNAK